MYDDGMANIYDAIYAATGKDYAVEAAELAELIRQHAPAATTVLDVACGTGEHLRHLRSIFPDIEGVELSEPMRAIAVAKVPGVPIHAGDMRTFALGRSFDAVLCLFSAIGYMRDTAELDAAIERLVAHLVPGGVLIVEPWLTPEQYLDGKVTHTIAEDGERTIVRMSYSRRDGGLSIMDMHYLVGDHTGVRSWMDTHTLGLFTMDEYQQALERAGLVEARLLAGWREGRDRLVALRPPA
jgi:SAM-dependent methyltransferase